MQSRTGSMPAGHAAPLPRRRGRPGAGVLRSGGSPGPLRQRLEDWRLDVKERSCSAAGFSIVELVVALMILGILSFLLIQRFSLMGDKAMGTTARMDSRSLVAALAADRTYNLVAGGTALTQTKLNTYLGLTSSGTDPTGAKTILLGRHDPKLGYSDQDPNFVTYSYQRGGVKVIAIIDLTSNVTLWHVSGMDDPRRIGALCDGLKITTADLDTLP